jgi:hypothetical protein
VEQVRGGAEAGGAWSSALNSIVYWLSVFLRWVLISLPKISPETIMPLSSHTKPKKFPACLTPGHRGEPIDMYAWGVCPCSTPEPADYLSAQDVVWDTRALRLALPEILHSRGKF